MPSIVIRTGPVMARAMHGMSHAIAALAMQGNEIVVDDFMMQRAEVDEYRTPLSHADLHFVGLFALIDLLEAREHARGDRQLGLAPWQFDRVHYGQTYDLEIDTSGSTPIENAPAHLLGFQLVRRR